MIKQQTSKKKKNDRYTVWIKLLKFSGYQYMGSFVFSRLRFVRNPARQRDFVTLQKWPKNRNLVREIFSRRLERLSKRGCAVFRLRYKTILRETWRVANMISNEILRACDAKIKPNRDITKYQTSKNLAWRRWPSVLLNASPERVVLSSALHLSRPGLCGLISPRSWYQNPRPPGTQPQWGHSYQKLPYYLGGRNNTVHYEVPRTMENAEIALYQLQIHIQNGHQVNPQISMKIKHFIRILGICTQL